MKFPKVIFLGLSIPSTIDALRLARLNLPDELYVCHSLPCSPAGDSVRSRIHHAISPLSSLGSWLADNAYQDANFHEPLEEFDKNPLAYREAWVTAMIEELEAQLEKQS